MLLLAKQRNRTLGRQLRGQAGNIMVADFLAIGLNLFFIEN
jgi:hypothetical protein